MNVWAIKKAGRLAIKRSSNQRFLAHLASPPVDVTVPLGKQRVHGQRFDDFDPHELVDLFAARHRSIR